MIGTETIAAVRQQLAAHRPPTLAQTETLLATIAELEAAATCDQDRQDHCVHQRTIAELGESEAKLRLVLDYLPAHVWTTDPDLRVTSVMGRGLAQLGIDPSNYVGEMVRELVGEPADESPAVAAHESALRGTPGAYTIDVLDRYFDASVEPLRDAQGQIVGCVGLALDVTDRKQAEQALQDAYDELEDRVHERTAALETSTVALQTEIAERRRAEEQLAWRASILDAMASAVPVGVLMIDNRTDAVLYVNHRFCELWGIEDLEAGLQRGELTNSELLRACLPRVREPQTLIEFCRAWPNDDHRSVVEDELPFADGRIIRRLSMQVNDPQERYSGRVYVFEDITERKQDEQSLRFQAQVLDAVGQAVIATDLDGTISYWNRCAETLYGWEAAKVKGQNILDITPTEATQAQAETIMARLQQGKRWTGEFVVRRHDGSSFPALVTDSPILDAAGQMTGIIGVSVDISEIKQTEAALRESERRFRAIFENAAVGIGLVNLTGQLLESNRMAQRMLGYSDDELRRMVFTEFTHPDDVETDVDLYRQLVAGQRDQYQVEKRYVRKDGRVIWARLTVSLIRDDAAQPQFAIAIVEDITTAKRVAAELATAQRKLIEFQEAAQLHLARELHDSVVQQLLGISYQLVDLEQHAVAAPAAALRTRLQALRQHVLDAVMELRHVIRELRPTGLEEFGLCTALEGYVAHLRRELQTGIPEIDLDLDPAIRSLPAPIALGLFRAAQEALRNALRHAEAHRITLQLCLSPTEATLRVRDDGCGFHVPDRLSQLTHSDHFGLMGIAERVNLVGGHCEIRSELGAGTEVIVRMPVSQKETSDG